MWVSEKHDQCCSKTISFEFMSEVMMQWANFSDFRVFFRRRFGLPYRHDAARGLPAGGGHGMPRHPARRCQNHYLSLGKNGHGKDDPRVRRKTSGNPVLYHQRLEDGS